MKVETTVTNENQFTPVEVSVNFRIETQEEYANLAQSNRDLVDYNYDSYDSTDLSPELKGLIKHVLQAIFPPKKDKKEKDKSK